MTLAPLVLLEWRRMVRQPLARAVLPLLGVLLVCSAAWSGRTAAAYRARLADTQAMLAMRRDSVQRTLPVSPVRQRAASQKAAELAYGVGRGELPTAPLPPSGGLALAVSRYQVLPTTMRASLEVRHVDGRLTGVLANPLLAGAGLPDLAAVVLVLLPLAVLALTCGLVQEERERGTWRLIRAQTRYAISHVLLVSLAWRGLAAFLVAWLACGVAFIIDPGATVTAFLLWGVALALFTTFWVAVGAMLSLLPVSLAGSATAALGVWLLLTFVVPSLVGQAAAATHPIPSRLETLVTVREIQQETEQRDAELLASWYAEHSAWRPVDSLVPSPVTWPVTFQPRFLAQDARVRPLMHTFVEQQARQLRFAEHWAWMSPALALTIVGDRLAGIDAERYAAYFAAVNRFEDRWRAFLVPRVMTYRGLARADVDSLPTFALEARALHMPARAGGALWALGLASVLALLLSWVRRHALRTEP